MKHRRAVTSDRNFALRMGVPRNVRPSVARALISAREEITLATTVAPTIPERTCTRGCRNVPSPYSGLCIGHEEVDAWEAREDFLWERAYRAWEASDEDYWDWLRA